MLWYQNLKHFSDLKITSLENFVNTLMKQKGLQRRKNLKEALLTLIKVSFAYSKMGYKKIGVSSSTFQNLLVCSKQTVFNFLKDIKNHFGHLIKIEKALDPTGRYRNFFQVDVASIQSLSELLTEEEHREIENLIKQLNLNTSVEEVLTRIKQDKKLTAKQLKKEIKSLLKQKQQFKQYLIKLFSKPLRQTQDIEKFLKEKYNANNPDFIKAVKKLVEEKGRTPLEAAEIAKIKYPPQM
ncbi:MAG: hypothetical protein GXO05_04460 [Aquificae bacterium]|nr:hypothetical protein [Aquificota bacterium]